MSTTTSEQRLPATGIARVVIEIGRGSLAVRWEETDEIVVTGEGVEVERGGEALGGETLLVRRGGHDRHFERDVERNIERWLKLGLGFGGEWPSFGAGDEGWRGRLSGQVTVTLPTTLPLCLISLRHRGDLMLEDPRGQVEARLGSGALRSRGGQAEMVLTTGSGEVAIDDLTGPLSVKTGSGEMTLTGITGPIRARTGSGEVLVRGGAGAVAARTGSGDVQIQGRASDEVNANTGSGEVILGHGSARSIDIHTGSGTIACSAVLGGGHHAFHTGSGDLLVSVPHGLAARVEAVTNSGTIHSELPLVSVGQRGPRSSFNRRLVGSLGEGAERAEIRLHTGRGDIRLGWLGAPTPPAPAVPLMPPVPPVPAVPPIAPLPPEPPLPPAGARAVAEDTVIILPPPPPVDAPVLADPDSPPALSAPALAGPPALEDEQRQVLQALANGAISVAEAEQLLAALEEAES